MSEVLLYYRQVNPTTWAYLSSLLIIALYFKFNRIWSVRNLDLALLILLAPGLMLIHFGQELQTAAHAWKPATTVAAKSIEADSPKENRDKPLSAEEDGKEETGDKSPPSEGESKRDQASQEPRPEGDPLAANTSNFNANDANTTASKENGPKENSARPNAPAASEKPAAPLDLRVVPQIHSAADRDHFLAQGEMRTRYGFIWLHALGVLMLIRLLLDSTMSRRPLLEPNLTQGGLMFVAAALFIFLMANVIKNSPSKEDMAGPIAAAEMVKGQPLADPGEVSPRQGPGSALIALLPSIPTIPILNEDARPASAQEVAYANVARGMAIGSHLAIILGMVLIGYRHFDNIKMGVGAAALYLMLPYTSQMTGRVEHALPAALLIWAVACYRQPMIAGILLGLAAGVNYYPLFLLPLWLSFYWPRGLMRFVSGLSYSLITCVLALFFFSRNMGEFWLHIQAMFGVWIPKTTGLEGIWSLGWDPMYRLPVITAFLVLSISMALWPAQKNLGTLLSCTAAVMVGTQFWHGYGGGLYMAWYLPLLLLTVFRPNLEDRVALSVLGEGWFPRRKRRELRAFDRAA